MRREKFIKLLQSFARAIGTQMRDANIHPYAHRLVLPVFLFEFGDSVFEESIFE